MEKLGYILLLCTVLSCQKDPQIGPVEAGHDGSESVSGKRLVIGCEGNFQNNNASLTVYGLTSGDVSQDVYLRANESGIGDVLQDLHHDQGILYAVVNNSGVIRMLDDSSFVEAARIDRLTSPRRVLQREDGLFWVTDLYAQAITVFSSTDATIVGSIPVAYATEDIVVHNGDIYAASVSDSVLLQFESASEIPTVELLDFAPNYLDTTQGMLFIAGNNYDHGSVLIIDSENRRNRVEVDELIFGSASYGGTLYILTRNRVDMYDSSLFRVGGFTHEAQTPYSLYVNKDGVFVADVKDYVSKGEVWYYNHGQELMDRIPTGYIPQSMTSY